MGTVWPRSGPYRRGRASVADGGDAWILPLWGSGDVVLHQLWGPFFDLVGNGGFSSVSFGWVLIKIPNLIEIILVVVLFVAGLFINLPDRTRREPEPPR